MTLALCIRTDVHVYTQSQAEKVAPDPTHPRPSVRMSRFCVLVSLGLGRYIVTVTHTQRVFGRNRGHFIYTWLPLSVYIHMYMYTHSHRWRRWIQLQLTLDPRRACSRFCVLVSLGLGHYVVTATHTQGSFGRNRDLLLCTWLSLYIHTHMYM